MRVIGIERDPLAQHLVERAGVVALEVPLIGDDIGQEPVELGRIVDQLFEQMPQVPIEQNLADIEYDRWRPNQGSFRHAKGPRSLGGPPCYRGRENARPERSTLARLEAAVGLVDHVYPAAATDHAVVPVTILERLQAVDDLHGGSSKQERHQDAPVPDFVAAPYAGQPGESSAPQIGKLALPGQSMRDDLLQIGMPGLPRQRRLEP